MRKVLFLLLLIAFVSCEKEKEPEEIKTSTVSVHVYYKYDTIDEEYIANPTMVKLYTQKISEFDLEKSLSSITSNYRMRLKNGEYAEPKYDSGSYGGFHTFTNIPHGDYTIIAYYKPDGYEWRFSYYFGYREITVSETTRHTIKFIWGEDNGKFVNK